MVKVPRKRNPRHPLHHNEPRQIISQRKLYLPQDFSNTMVAAYTSSVSPFLKPMSQMAHIAFT